MSRLPFVILGRKRWGVRGGVIFEIATLTSHLLIERCHWPALSLAAEENEVTVTHIRSATSGKLTTKAR